MPLFWSGLLMGFSSWLLLSLETERLPSCFSIQFFLQHVVNPVVEQKAETTHESRFGAHEESPKDMRRFYLILFWSFSLISHWFRWFSYVFSLWLLLTFGCYFSFVTFLVLLFWSKEKWQWLGVVFPRVTFFSDFSPAQTLPTWHFSILGLFMTTATPSCHSLPHQTHTTMPVNSFLYCFLQIQGGNFCDKTSHQPERNPGSFYYSLWWDSSHYSIF